MSFPGFSYPKFQNLPNPSHHHIQVSLKTILTTSRTTPRLLLSDPSRSSNFQAILEQKSLLHALMIPLKHSAHLRLWMRTKPRESEIPTHSAFSDTGNGSYSSNRSLPLLNSSLAVPRTGRINVYIYLSISSFCGLCPSHAIKFFRGPDSSWRLSPV